jgi:hypothetical protein
VDLLAFEPKRPSLNELYLNRYHATVLALGAVMAAIEFSLPRQWEDWCSWLLGIWLCISPWALHFDSDPTATQTAAISGILIICAQLATLSVFQSWEEWINVLLGAWLILCSWILGIGSSAARMNFVIVGALITALAFYEIWDGRRKLRSDE